MQPVEAHSKKLRIAVQPLRIGVTSTHRCRVVACSLVTGSLECQQGNAHAGQLVAQFLEVTNGEAPPATTEALNLPLGVVATQDRVEVEVGINKSGDKKQKRGESTGLLAELASRRYSLPVLESQIEARHEALSATVRCVAYPREGEVASITATNTIRFVDLNSLSSQDNTLL